jgi:hypothetical protein
VYVITIFFSTSGSLHFLLFFLFMSWNEYQKSIFYSYSNIRLCYINFHYKTFLICHVWITESSYMIVAVHTYIQHRYVTSNCH